MTAVTLDMFFDTMHDSESDLRQSTQHKLARIQSLEAGCAQCSKLQNGTCPGNKVGHPCKDYHARSSAGDNCMNCKHLGGRLPHQQSGKDMYYCNEHKNTVALDDYCCHKFTEK